LLYQVNVLDIKLFAYQSRVP